MTAFARRSRNHVCMLGIAAVLLAAPVHASDLVLEFPFDVDADDASGNGNHGTDNNTSTASGVVDDAYAFNGSSSYVSFPDLGIFNGDENFAIMFWFKADNVTTRASLIDLHGEAKTLIEVDSGNLIGRAQVDGHWRDLKVPVTTGTWYHVVYTYHTDRGTALYLDGRLAGSNATTGTIPAEEDPGSNRVGCYFRDNLHFDGLIDEVQIYTFD